jgi:hypothetical protein
LQPDDVEAGLLQPGFYKVRFTLNDAAGRGVMYTHAGRMLGGNSSFALGTYRESDGEIIAEIKTLRHHTDPDYRPLAGTTAKGEYPIFGGHEVGIGFSGSCDDQGVRLEATALAGRRSLRLTADLKLVRRA